MLWLHQETASQGRGLNGITYEKVISIIKYLHMNAEFAGKGQDFGIARVLVYVAV